MLTPRSPSCSTPQLPASSLPDNQCLSGGSALAVQWLRLPASNAGHTGSIPRQGTKILHAVCHRQKVKTFYPTFHCSECLHIKLALLSDPEQERHLPWAWFFWQILSVFLLAVPLPIGNETSRPRSVFYGKNVLVVISRSGLVLFSWFIFPKVDGTSYAISLGLRDRQGLALCDKACVIRPGACGAHHGEGWSPGGPEKKGAW